MKTTRLSFALALAIGSCFAVAAQTTDQQTAAPAARQHNPAHAAERMAKKLGLTSDQTAQLQPILAERSQQRLAIRNDQSLSPKDRHAQMTTLRQNTDAKIKALLTEDQKQKYGQMQQEMRDHMRQHREQRNQS
jgi:protein CpxP